MFAPTIGRIRGWGARTRTGPARTKTWQCCQLHHPPNGQQRRPPRRYYDARVPAPTVVILAAGEGTRMRSSLPKVLHPLCGRPLIAWPVAAAREAGAARVIVVDNPKRRLADLLPEGVEIAIQEEPNGTGDAVAAAASLIDPTSTVVVINGDVPLITAEAIKQLVDAHEAAGAAATMATMELDDPGDYGRVIRDSDGSVERVVETKAAGDATPEELAIREVNTRRLRVRRRRADRGAADARHRQRPGRAVPARRAARDARGGPQGRRAPDRRPRPHARRQRPRRARVRPPARPDAASTSAHMRNGVTIVDPGEHDDRRGRADRRATR